MTREEASQIIAIWLVSSKGAKGQLGYIEGWFDEEDAEAFRMAIEALSERKKGRWVKMSDRDGIYWACSECGEDIPSVSHFNPQFDLFPRLERIDKTNYCPNCGADMRGEQE